MSHAIAAHDIRRYCEDEDIRFIRLAFCDIFGRQKNISIMPRALERAVGCGIAIDGSAVKGFSDGIRSDLFLRPDPDTLTILPWRPEQQRVARMYCSVIRPDGSFHECDSRNILAKAAETAGGRLLFGHEHEFRLTREGVPCDEADYLDVQPLDQCSDVRRQMCLTLEQMGMLPESSHHGCGAGHCRISFGDTLPMDTANGIMTFGTALGSITAADSLRAEHHELRINISAARAEQADDLFAGITAHSDEITRFLSRGKDFDADDLREGENRLSLRLPTENTNPYIALALIIGAAIDPKNWSAEGLLPERIIELYSQQDQA
ncbi:glutamine synthetase [Ruminococcus sp. YE71]|uniref:glutamine synthetase beta-grasp domain-containing protein n=1 Tax=unclassified Ruminococcus TaxID=2608920 RepID=UPI0008862873|nr:MULTISPECIES: glutamine synthetase beta-grasp domain-containing protein [unclassified Ruminococcus]SDA26571.1 glutamine synthetase [Ruminococcus sp. YE78]SFW44248.1 glutamine synthetase [Ruminococcus sp. YE71]